MKQRCWLADGCPSKTAVCSTCQPDGDDCPVWRWFKYKMHELNIKDAKTIVKESEWLEDSDPGQTYGTTWACRECGHSLHEHFIWNPYERKWNYCPWCGRKMVKSMEESNETD